MMTTWRTVTLPAGSSHIIVEARGGGGTPLKGANGDFPLDGVAFSRLE